MPTHSHPRRRFVCGSCPDFLNRAAPSFQSGAGAGRREPTGATREDDQGRAGGDPHVRRRLPLRTPRQTLAETQGRRADLADSLPTRRGDA